MSDDDFYDIIRSSKQKQESFKDDPLRLFLNGGASVWNTDNWVIIKESQYYHRPVKIRIMWKL